MHPLIENNREAIARLCRVHGVRRLGAFGSILRDDFDAGRSDVDVLVEFEAQAADSFSNFLDLKESLEADEKTRAAVERVLEVCGEAMSNLYRVAPTVAETIPHARDIIGFRNILAHGYAELDHNKVYPF